MLSFPISCLIPSKHMKTRVIHFAILYHQCHCCKGVEESPAACLSILKHVSYLFPVYPMLINWLLYLHRQVKQREGTENKRPCWAQSKATTSHIHSSMTRSLCRSTKKDSPSVSKVSSKEITSLSEYDLIILRTDRCYTIVCNIKQSYLYRPFCL